MNKIKKRMIAEAEQKYSRIFPCTTRPTLNECFTVEDNLIILWFNTEDATTHTMTAHLK
jgi:hypothetical protein